MWSLGSILGSALGGFTAQPARFHPHLFSPDGLFGHYPYLLPNLVAVGAIVIALILGWLFLEETNPSVRPRRESRGDDSIDEVTERTPLRSRERRESAVDAISTGSGGVSYAAGSAPIPNEPAFDLRRPSFASITSFRPLMKDSSTVEAAIDDDQEPALDPRPVKAFNKAVIFWTVALGLMCYHQMAFGSLLPVYLLDEPRRPPGQLDLIGGLGLTLPGVGTFLAINSVLALFFQGVVFPIYVARLGVWKTVVSLTLFSPLVHIAVPFVTLLPNPKAGVYVALALQSFTTIIVYPSLLILLKNATESPLVLGKVNGLAMSGCSAARTIAPPLGGILYSALGSAAAWWSCAVISIAAIVELSFAPRPKDDDATILRRASTAMEAPPMADNT